MGITKKRLVLRIVATVLMLCIIVAFSVASYISVWRNEEGHCWHMLSTSAQGVSTELVTRMNDNGNILQLAAGAILEGESYSSPENIINHVNQYLDLTIFSRIDIIFPDNTILLYNGETIDGQGVVSSFDEIASQGQHISPRSTDFLTGKEVVYYDVPVIHEDEAIAVLIGVIDCTMLPNYFNTNIYDGHADCLLIDRTDGSIIMDSMYGDFSNFYDYENIQPLNGYNHVDLTNSIRNSESGFFAYESPRNNNQSYYMYYSPIEGYNWHLLVTVNEDLAFSELNSLKKNFVSSALIECVIIIFFVMLNVAYINQITKSKAEAEYQLHKSNALIECVTELSSNQDIDCAINNLLSTVNGYFDGDRTYLFDINYDNQTTNNLYEFVAEGVSKEIDNLQNVPLSSVDSWIAEFEQSGIFYISNIDQDVIRNSNTYEILAAQNINSLIAVPLKRSNVIIGFMGVDNPKKNYNDLTLLSSVQFFITEAMERKSAQEALTNMSYTDTLTHLHNRNKFNYVCDEFHRYPRTRVGVAFFDLDGLKHINDTLGHDAGDNLIISTADCIRSRFSGNSYRIGGDEFAVILPDVGKEEFEAQVNEVRRLLEKNNVSVAIGTSWREVALNLKQQLKEADQLMYVEKAEHRRLLAEKLGKKQ